MEEKKKKSKRFLEKPQYPGGAKALRDFLVAHLQYPQDAMEQRLYPRKIPFNHRKIVGIRCHAHQAPDSNMS